MRNKTKVKKTKHVRQIIDIIKSTGAKFIEVLQTRRHLRFITELPSGDRHTVFASLTPTDHRTYKNIKAELRRHINAE